MRESAKNRFWLYVDKKSEGECWEWTGGRDTQGYGLFFINNKYRCEKAHRVSAWLSGKRFGNGLNVCHHCDNPPCVNPKHLFLGTRKDNIRDCISKNRLTRGNKSGVNNPRSIINELDVKTIRFFYSMGSILQRELGEMFGLTQTAVSLIVRNKNWSNVK